MTSIKAWLVHVRFHALVLLFQIPALYFVVSAVMGCLLAAVESWRAIDGLLYVGGNLVLIPLTDVVPVTVGGKVFDLIVSIFTFGSLGWGLSMIGLLPFCAGTRATLHTATSLLHRGERPGLASLLTASVFTVLLWPIVCAFLSAVIALFLAPAEGWTYSNSFLRCLGIMSHVPSLAPKALPPASYGGKIVILLNAFMSAGICLGWTVGVFLLLPGLGRLAALLNKLNLTKGEGLLAKTVNFCVVVLAIVPLIVLPLSLALGTVLSEAEGWGSVTTGLLYIGGNLIGVPLSSAVPTSASGKAVDVVVSCIGVGCFGCLVALLGQLDFTDRCCEALGGKIEGRVSALKFTLTFYLVVMPVVCVVAALPMGGILAVAEGWGFGDGWLSVLSVLAQAPSLAPPGLAVESDGGKFIIFLIGCYSLCVTIGWGAGLVVASSALDGIGGGISDVVAKMMAAAGAPEAKSAEGAPEEAKPAQEAPAAAAVGEPAVVFEA